MADTSPAPFKYILLKVRINARKVDRLEGLGVPVVERTDTRALELRATHAAQLGTRHYERLGFRFNAAGDKLGDSGVLALEFNADKPQQGQPADPSRAMNLETIAQDLHNAGYGLADLHVLLRPGEQSGMGFLVLVFQISEKHMSMSQDLAQLVDDYVDGHYRSVFVWENPDGSCTINANRAVVGAELEAVTDRRTLRFAWAGGQTAWEALSVSQAV